MTNKQYKLIQELIEASPEPYKATLVLLVDKYRKLKKIESHLTNLKHRSKNDDK